MFGRVSRARQLLQVLDQYRHVRHVQGDQIRVVLAEVRDQRQSAEQHTMVLAVLQQRLGLVDEVLLKVRHLADDAHRAKGRLLLDVRVRGGEESLDLLEQIAGHLLGGDVAECAQRQSDDVLILMLQIAGLTSQPHRATEQVGKGGRAHFLREFVTSVKTSWFSSNSNMVPRYPNRLSANLGEASSLRHSIWPKCVRSPSVKRYRSFATLFLLRFGDAHRDSACSFYCSGGACSIAGQRGWS